MHIGELIHSARKEKRVTLVQLSEKSGVAVATLSRIENGKMTGTIDSHRRICEALEVPLPDLYREMTLSSKEVEVQTKRSKTELLPADRSFTAEILATKASGKKMMPMMLKIKKGGATNKEENRIGIEKFIYLLTGKVDAYIDKDIYSLSEGDTLYFDSSMPHCLKNVGMAEAVMIQVICPPVV